MQYIRVIRLAGWRQVGKVTRNRRRGREVENGEEYRRDAEVGEGQYGCDAEVVRRAFEESAGDHGRDRGLFQEGVRAKHRRDRETHWREVARKGDRGADRLRQELLRELCGGGNQARRALCRPRQGGLQAVREPVREGRLGQVTRRFGADE